MNVKKTNKNNNENENKEYCESHGNQQKANGLVCTIE